MAHDSVPEVVAAPASLPASSWLLDGHGGIAATSFPPAVPERGFALVVGSPADPAFIAWLAVEAGPYAAGMMTTARARTRCTVVEDRLVIVLRLGREDGAHPQTLSLLVEKHRLIVATHMDLARFMGIAQWAAARHAPQSPGDFIARLGLRSADRLEPLIEKVSDGLDTLEQKLLGASTPDIRRRLADLRRTIITIRRAIWPQRDALDSIEIEDVSFLTDKDRLRLREATSRLERLELELRALAERSGLVHESLMDARAEQMNRTILVLTAVTVVFMPLTLLSGLLGMNVGGIPFADQPWGFWAVLGGLAVIAAATLVAMRLRRWL